MNFAIQNEAKEHLGFLLTAGGPESGSCIIRSLPSDPRNFETAESNHLHSLQVAGEHRWRREVDGRMFIEDAAGNEIAVINDNNLL
jgi:hypothetical protein